MKIPHLEDYLITTDPAASSELMTALYHDIYHDSNLGQLTIKYDGYLVVIGKENGRFFISNKSFFNKTPIKFFSVSEIMNHPKWVDAKKKKLSMYFEYLKDLHILEGEIKTIEIIGCPYTKTGESTARPNILEYKFQWNPLDWNFQFIDHQYQFIQKTYKPVDFGWDQFYDLLNFQPACGLLSSKRFADFSKLVNSCIRDNISIDCVAHTNPEYFTTIKNYKNLKSLKKRLLDDLYQSYCNPHVTVMVDNKLTNQHEGFVYKYKDTRVKLIDRYHFSRLNFSDDTIRGWTK